MEADQSKPEDREFELELLGYEQQMDREFRRSQAIAILNHMEDMATAAEDHALVFEIMALKQRLGLPITRPSTPPN